MIQQPSVADPDRQFRRVRESFTAELFLLLSREMRKDRSSLRGDPKARPSLPSYVARSIPKLQRRISPAREHLGPTTRDRRHDNRSSRGHFYLKRRAARTARRVTRFFRFLSKRTAVLVPAAAPLFAVAVGDPRAPKTRMKSDLGRWADALLAHMTCTCLSCRSLAPPRHVRADASVFAKSPLLANVSVWRTC